MLYSYQQYIFTPPSIVLLTQQVGFNCDIFLPELGLCLTLGFGLFTVIDPCAIHCKEGIVITTDSLLFQIQMSEHNSLPCGGKLHDNLFLILSQLSSTLSYHLGN